jgi:hypothetical protein
MDHFSGGRTVATALHGRLSQAAPLNVPRPGPSNVLTGQSPLPSIRVHSQPVRRSSKSEGGSIPGSFLRLRNGGDCGLRTRFPSSSVHSSRTGPVKCPNRKPPLPSIRVHSRPFAVRFLRLRNGEECSLRTRFPNSSAQCTRTGTVKCPNRTVAATLNSRSFAFTFCGKPVLPFRLRLEYDRRARIFLPAGRDLTDQAGGAEPRA